MAINDILILALALALDAMIVCFSYGLVVCYSKLKNSLKLSFSFGFFQFFMPIIGYYLSSLVYDWLDAYSKWIVFTVFMCLAIKFLKSAIETKEETDKKCISLICLFWLSIATSIDALGGGVSIRFTDSEILLPSVYIGVVTFVVSFFGFWLACMLKKIPTKNIEIIGAGLFIYLAIKTIL